NKPRIPSLKQVLGAAKKPSTEFSMADLGLAIDDITPKNKVKSIKGFVMNRKNIIYKDGTPEEKVNALIASLTKEGAL
ncbi:MAG: Electron transfer flavoprotein alpha/beta-subunit, partial [Massilibacillus sp.]|nr:Electron transfer flavoprotein alpha/beta-subunit [Massilibacillus sp.]